MSIGNWVYAGSLGMDAEYRADYSTNTFQDEIEDDQLEELTHNYRVSFFGATSGAKSQSNFIANLEYIDYQDDTDDDVALTSFIGSSEIAISTRSLSWIFVDALGYFDPSPRLSFNQRDRERVNYFLTGPKFKYAIDSDSEVGTRLFYINQDRIGSANDYDQFNFNAYWDQAKSLRDNWGVEVLHRQRKHPTNNTSPDFTLSDLSTYYRRRTQSDRYIISVGATLLDEQDDARENEVSGNFNLGWEHLFTRRVGIETSGGINLRDDMVLSTPAISSTGTFEQDDQTGLFYEKSLESRAFYTGVYSQIEIGIEGRSLDYINNGQGNLLLDNDQNTYRLFSKYQRFIGRTMTFDLGLEAEQRDYSDNDFEESLLTANASLNRKLARTLDLQFELQFLRGISNLPLETLASEEREFDEYIFSIGLFWEPSSSRVTSRESSEFFDLSLINQ